MPSPGLYTDPTITCKNTIVYLDVFGNGFINNGDVVVNVNDNCFIQSVIASDYNFTCSDICPDAVDQQQLHETGTFGPNLGLAQTFVAGASGPLTRVRLAAGGWRRDAA